MWIILERLIRRFGKYLPWQAKYLLGKAGVGGMDISVDRHFEYAFVINRLKNQNSGVLVDIGGGGSILPPMLAAMGYKVIGYDLYPWSLLYPGYEHRVGNACAMQLKDCSVDVCVSVSCLEHIGDKRYGSIGEDSDRAVMKEIWRILRPGGRFLITIPYGVAHVYPAHRVYDEKDLKELTKGFVEVSREIFVPSDDEDLYHYRMGSAEEAKVKRPWHRYSVIALEFKKPGERL